MTSFVMFIVNTINPVTEFEAPKTSTLAHLRDLIQATESFFHPSNSGPWSHALALFLQSFAWDFLQRLKRGMNMCSRCFDLGPVLI
jgi:proteasome activator subunit 4